ncbi:hypothetical protein [Streptomyces sp. WAC 01529]|uniref:hypothetical protein n=1 Tax=Streptomyces sp. WAC 01529 TaxID=2203205 RepID=UPI001F0BA37B|nr:hypothetical protein [Streptomyces sp. WAC 01529]
MPYEPIPGEAVALRTGLLLLPFALLVGAVLVCAGDRFMARAGLSRIVRDGIASDRLPWTSAKAMRRMALISNEQTRLELPYDHPESFVGAGRLRMGRG